MRSTAALLAQLDPLPYRNRMTTLAGWARGADDHTRVLAGLRAGGPYERFLALTAAMVTGDRAAVTAALADDDRTVRGPAVVHSLRAGWLHGEVIVAMVADAPA